MIQVIVAATATTIRLFLPVPQQPIVGPETTVVVSPLHDDGTVDYVTAINQLWGGGVTPQENAMVPLSRTLRAEELRESMRERFFARLGVAPDEDPSDDWVESYEVAELVELTHEQLLRAEDSPWTAEELPGVAEWLRVNERALQRYDEAMARPAMWSPIVSRGERESLARHAIPDRRMHRRLARAVVCRAMLRLGEGDVEAAVADALRLHRHGRLVMQKPTVLSRVVGASIVSLANQVVAAVARDPRATPESLERILRDLAELPPPLPMAETLNGERYVILDTLQGTFEDPGAMRLLFGGGASLLLPYIDRAGVLRSTNVFFDEAVRIAGTEPIHKRLAAFDRWAEDRQRLAPIVARTARVDDMGRAFMDIINTLPGPDLGARILNAWSGVMSGLSAADLRLFAILGPLSAEAKSEVCTTLAENALPVILSPMFSAMARSEADVFARFDLSRIALGLMLHRAESGDWPASLDVLAPRWLPEIPGDPFSGEPLRYRVEGDAAVVYSVARDGEDDGGVEDLDGDIVLRVERNKKPTP